MDIYSVLASFLIYSFLGWCVEVIYAAVTRGIFVNRGFLFGPVCPIYGIGMAAVLVAVKPIEQNIVILYIAVVIITTIIEFIAGLLAEKLFHQRLWDYSNVPLNIKGYVCLKFSLLWGIGGVFIVKVVHRLIFIVVDILPRGIGWIIIVVFMAALIADLVLTLIEALKIPKRIAAIEELEKLMHNVSDNIGENLSDATFKVMENKPRVNAKIEKCRAIIGEKTATAKRLTKAFPALSKLDERLDRIRKKGTDSPDEASKN